MDDDDLLMLVPMEDMASPLSSCSGAMRKRAKQPRSICTRGARYIRLAEGETAPDLPPAKKNKISIEDNVRNVEVGSELLDELSGQPALALTLALACPLPPEPCLFDIPHDRDAETRVNRSRVKRYKADMYRHNSEMRLLLERIKANWALLDQ